MYAQSDICVNNQQVVKRLAESLSQRCLFGGTPSYHKYVKIGGMNETKAQLSYRIPSFYNKLGVFICVPCFPKSSLLRLTSWPWVRPTARPLSVRASDLPTVRLTDRPSDRTLIIEHACIMIIIHVSCSKRLCSEKLRTGDPREGAKPPGKAGGLEGHRPSNGVS